MSLVFGQQAYIFLMVLDGNTTKFPSVWETDLGTVSLNGIESYLLLALGRSELIQKKVRTSPDTTPKSK